MVADSVVVAAAAVDMEVVVAAAVAEVRIQSEFILILKFLFGFRISPTGFNINSGFRFRLLQLRPAGSLLARLPGAASGACAWWRRRLWWRTWWR